MKKEQLISIAKKAAVKSPLSNYTDEQWKDLSGFLLKFSHYLEEPAQDNLHQKIASLLKDFGVSTGEPSYLTHYCEKRGKVVDDKLTIEAEVLFGLENIVEKTKEQEREACAKLLELDNQSLMLMAGEMSPGELRTTKAVLKGLAFKIRDRG